MFKCGNHAKNHLKNTFRDVQYDLHLINDSNIRMKGKRKIIEK